jgi:UbiD family decarboxylase
MGKDLHSFIEEIEKSNSKEVYRVRGKVDLVYEATAYVLELEKIETQPIVIFENIDGFSMSVVSNVCGTRERCAKALGTTSYELTQEWLKREKRVISPKLVSNGPVKEIVLKEDNVDINSLPIPKHFKQDAGHYITSGILVAKDPETGVINSSYHRLQVKGKNKLGVSLHSRRHLWDFQRRAEECNESIEVAIVIGVHPAISLGSVWAGSISDDHYNLIGSFLEEPLEVVKCESINLCVPAYSEIVLEGEILPNVKEKEGPFGEYTGYLSDRSTQNVIEIKSLSKRKNPLYQNIVPGKSAEHNLLGGSIPKTPTIYRAVKAMVPTLKDVSMPSSGVCRYHCYISIKKMAEGQGKNAILAAFGADYYLKLVVVVDEDVNVHDESDVIWALATRMQADEDVFVISDVMGNLLDPSSQNGITAKMGIDATKPLENWTAKKVTIPDEIRKLVQSKIFSHGLKK